MCTAHIICKQQHCMNNIYTYVNTQTEPYSERKTDTKNYKLTAERRRRRRKKEKWCHGLVLTYRVKLALEWRRKKYYFAHLYFKPDLQWNRKIIQSWPFRWFLFMLFDTGKKNHCGKENMDLVLKRQHKRKTTRFAIVSSEAHKKKRTKHWYQRLLSNYSTGFLYGFLSSISFWKSWQ